MNFIAVVLILSLAAGCSGHVISCDVIAGEILGDSNRLTFETNIKMETGLTQSIHIAVS